MDTVVYEWGTFLPTLEDPVFNEDFLPVKLPEVRRIYPTLVFSPSKGDFKPKNSLKKHSL